MSEEDVHPTVVGDAEAQQQVREHRDKVKAQDRQHLQARRGAFQCKPAQVEQRRGGEAEEEVRSPVKARLMAAVAGEQQDLGGSQCRALDQQPACPQWAVGHGPWLGGSAHPATAVISPTSKTTRGIGACGPRQG